MNIWCSNLLKFSRTISFLMSLSHKNMLKYISLVMCTYVSDMQKKFKILRGFLLKNMNVIPWYIYLYLSTWLYVSSYCANKKLKTCSITSLFIVWCDIFLAAACMSFSHTYTAYLSEIFQLSFRCEQIYKTNIELVFVGTIVPENYALSSFSASISVSS